MDHSNMLGVLHHKTLETMESPISASCWYIPRFSRLLDASASVRTHLWGNLVRWTFLENAAMPSTKPAFGAVLLAACIGMVVAAGSGEPKVLDGPEGKDITLPDKLMGSGALLWRSPPCDLPTCLRVLNGFVVTRSSKVSWNNSTGVIVVKHLQKNESSQLTLEIRNSSSVTRIVYNLTVLAPTVAPPGNEWLQFPLVLVLVPVLVLILVFAGLVYHFRLWEKAARFIQARRDGGSAAGPAAVNGHEENHPMMEKKEENPV